MGLSTIKGFPLFAASLPSSWWQHICRWMWHRMLFLWGTAIVGIVSSVLASIFTTTTDIPLSKLLVVHWVLTYPIPIISGAGVLLVLTIVSWIGSREDKATLSLSSDQQSRTNILKTLRKAYTDELAASLQGMAHIVLGLHERFDLTHPARLSSRHAGQAEQALPDGTTIVDVYDQAGNGLLILGNPGAGKSTLLYDLAKDPLTRAEQDKTNPLPVILNLSSWAKKRLPLEAWLVEQLYLHYNLPPQIGQRWEQRAKLLPLLDGLDEVATSSRDACIEAINTYRSKHLVPLVVCSRREEYQALPQLGTPEQQQRQIFECYVEHMLERQITKEYFTPQQTRQWLTWLALRMQQYSLSEFILNGCSPLGFQRNGHRTSTVRSLDCSTDSSLDQRINPAVAQCIFSTTSSDISSGEAELFPGSTFVFWNQHANVFCYDMLVVGIASSTRSSAITSPPGHSSNFHHRTHRNSTLSF